MSRLWSVRAAVSKISMLAGVLALLVCAAPATVQANDPPEIVNWDRYLVVDNYYVFEGVVVDEQPYTCIVLFGDALDGYYSFPYEDGYFYVCEYLPNGAEALVSAIAYDDLFQASAERMFFLQ